MSTLSPTSGVSGSGLVKKEPSRPRIARTIAPVRCADVRVPDSRPDELGALGEPHVGQPELEAPVVHDDVHEVGHVGLEGECSHAGASDLLRVHHSIRSGLEQLALGRLHPGPGHDEQVGAS